MSIRNDDPSPVGVWDAFWTNLGALDVPSPVVDRIRALFNGQVREKRILEVGAGSGRDIVALAREGVDAYANDISPVARKGISDLAARYAVSVEVIEDDLRALRYPNGYFDLVYSQGVVEHFPDHESVIKEQVRVTKPGGFVIVDVPQTFNPYTIYKHVLMALHKWPAGWEKQFSPISLRRSGERCGLRLQRMYSWGEHGKIVQAALGWMDSNPWTATCIGAVFQKSGEA